MWYYLRQIRVLRPPPPTHLLLLLLMEFLLLPQFRLLLQLLIFETRDLTLVGQLVWIVYAEQYYLCYGTAQLGVFSCGLTLTCFMSYCYIQ